jgi:hypothetical protein
MRRRGDRDGEPEGASQLLHGSWRREWTFKAMDLLATKFGLFEGGAQIGSVYAGPWVNRVQDVRAELPEKMPREVQMFLLAVFIGKLTTPSN